MKRCNYCILMFLLLLGSFVSYGQKTVTGNVTDAANEILPGVNIIEKGTNNGVSSDFDGNYQITVSSDAVLVFSFLGFQVQEIAVTNLTELDVVMKDDLQNLDEVVLIGYGSVLKEDISGSVASVEVSALENVPQMGIDQLLQGRASGVYVTPNSGQPGSSVSVRIRGVNSISGSSEPLYIVDGVPISGDATDQASELSPIASINPNDIEKVDILKDASATAIYGSRGSNGVVIITTKKGKSGKGVFKFDSWGGMQVPTNKIEVMGLQDYARLQNAIGDIYNLNEIPEFRDPDILGDGTDWQAEIFSPAPISSNTLSFSGGNEDTDYFISMGYDDQDGTVIGSSFNRTSVRTNLNTQLKDWVKVGISLTASRSREKLTLNGRSDGIVGLSLLNNPAIAVYNPDGSFAGPNADDDFRTENPIAKALSLDNTNERTSVLGNIYADFKLSNHFSYRTELGGNFVYNKNVQFTPTYSYGEIEVGTNTLTERRDDSEYWIWKNLVTYQDSFNDKHDLTVLLGHEIQESSWEGILSSDGDFVSNDVPILGTGDAVDSNTQFKGSSSLLSFFSRAIYSYDARYSITASIRADGSSKFADGNKWGYFPSISGSWKLSNEKFMSNVDGIQNIKLFGGYGEVGNQDIPNYAYGSRLSTVQTGLGTGFLLANYANPNLTWESSTQINLGLDFSLFQSRLFTTIEVYKKVSKDFLYQLAVTDFITGGSSVGAVQAPWVNLGEMVNSGVDLTLSYKTLGNSKLTWNSTLTLSHYKNEVTELLGDLKINGNMNINYDGEQNITITEVGQPIGLFYGLEVEGMFRTTEDFKDAAIQYGRPFEDALFATTWLGDIKYKDQNNDGIIDDNDRTVIGSPHPDFTFGWQNSFYWNNWDLSVFLQGSYGNDLFNGIGRLLTAGNRTYTNQLPSVLDYWSVDNPDAGSPRLARNDTRNTDISDRYIEDGSYARIQNVILGYTIPMISSKAGISKFKVYGGVQNLYTFTNYTGYDPEIGSYQQNTLLTGIDAGRYPMPRTYTLGINIEF